MTTHGDSFKKNIAEWSVERLEEFLAYRRWLISEGPASICLASTAKGVSKHAPFMSSDYPHAAIMGSVSSKEWRAVMRADHKDLVSPDPFTPSPYRSGGKKVWDAAVGIPACQHRSVNLISMAATPVLRNCNRHWNEVIVPALRTVGPLGTNGAILRPESPMIVDFTKIKNGWIYIEAAHVLAHLRGDTKRVSKNAGAIPSATTGHFQASLANIAVALIYDLPLYIGRYDEGMHAMPDFPDFGIEVKSSSRFGMPFLRAPWLNNEALRFDSTLAVVNVGVFIEPHPYGYNSGTLEPLKNDHWCCMPTMAMITGWETVDVITHQPLVSAKIDDPYSPICYGMHPADLMPPDLLWAYLALGQRSIGRPPIVDDKHVYVDEWVKSPGFIELVKQTRPLPCKMCIALNQRTEGVPRRPAGRRPKPSKIKDHKEWKEYYAEIAKILGILDAAVLRYEPRFYGTTRAILKRTRKLRNAGWKARMCVINDERLFDEAIDKVRKGKTLKGDYARVYSARRV